MHNSFLLLPERLAREPLSLDEAAHRFGVGSVPLAERHLLTMQQRVTYGHYSRRAILLLLMGGELPAFVQEVGIGAWFRVPKGYWLSGVDSVEAAVERPYLPEILEERAFVVMPVDISLVGQPIVVWQDDVERLHYQMGGTPLPPQATALGLATKYPGAGPQEDATTLNTGDELPPLFKRRASWDEHVAWYRERIEKAPPQGFTRDEDVAAGQAVGIGRQRVRELRNELKPDHWQKRGRPAGGK